MISGMNFIELLYLVQNISSRVGQGPSQGSVRYVKYKKGPTAKHSKQQVYTIINRMGIYFYTGMFLLTIYVKTTY